MTGSIASSFTSMSRALDSFIATLERIGFRKPPVDVIYDALRKRGALEGCWKDPDFHCFSQYPLVVRIAPVVTAIESQASNGGFPQLLWNTFAHWWELIEDGIAAYGTLGLDQQSGALRQVRTTLEKLEPVCLVRIQEYAITRDFGQFGEWMKEAAPHFPPQTTALFFHDSARDRIKGRFLRAHLREILSAINGA